MQRCLQLAQLAIGDVAPNPMVGAVLVYQNNIIGEGYHRQYGQAHAEVMCISSVKKEQEHLIEHSTLYVSLEPCAHWGKTPPCADLIIEKKIRKVVIGCRDPFAEVDGKGMEKLRAAGVGVETGILEEECKDVNKRFFTFHLKKRPFVVLKWAQSLDGKIATSSVGRVLISNEWSNRMVHKWRSEEAAIAVGTHTTLHDDPQLNTRLWPGKSPVRVVVDRNLRLPLSLHLFDGAVPTIVFNTHQHSIPTEKTAIGKLSGVNYYQVTEDVNLVQQILIGLHRLNIQSVLVEGGAQLLQSFIDEGLWDEARVITNNQLVIGSGLPAPVLSNHRLVTSQTIFSDIIHFYQHTAL